MHKKLFPDQSILCAHKQPKENINRSAGRMCVETFERHTSIRSLLLIPIPKILIVTIEDTVGILLVRAV